MPRRTAVAAGKTSKPFRRVMKAGRSESEGISNAVAHSGSNAWPADGIFTGKEAAGWNN
jgi:hypothetical protein